MVKLNLMFSLMTSFKINNTLIVALKHNNNSPHRVKCHKIALKHHFCYFVSRNITFERVDLELSRNVILCLVLLRKYTRSQLQADSMYFLYLLKLSADNGLIRFL